MLIFAVVNKYYMKDNRYPEIEEEEGIGMCCEPSVG